MTGWSISKRIDAKLVVGALEQALQERKPPPGCIHHSDQGVQYACDEYVEVLEDNGFKYEDVVEGLPRFVEAVYNKKRRHSSLGYMSPDDSEKNGGKK